MTKDQASAIAQASYPSLRGKLAVVTGGANGIGRASAQLLANQGAKVVLLDREHDALEEAKQMISSGGGCCSAFELDLTDRGAVENVFGRIAREIGGVDILLNNVGQTAREKISGFAESSQDTWEFVIRVSLMTTLICSHQVVAEMKTRRSGKIINVASDSPLVGDANLADYSAAKLGVVGFTRSLAREMAPYSVNVNAVSPGPTNTRGPRRMAGDMMAKTLMQVPSGAMCEPSDIANCICFLASDSARFVHGQNVGVNARAFG